ncbi:MAG: response regulator [Elusimicrobia bacterium]|nr:response regulator [Elusimicrobiota bacterium]
MKVLIVDDNGMTRGMIKDLLKEIGHEVLGEAEDGCSAIKAFADLRPDVVLLDLLMPKKSGMEVLENIRKIDPAVKVIIVTAVGQDIINKKLLDKGANAILRKPFSYEELKDVLKQIV